MKEERFAFAASPLQRDILSPVGISLA